MSLLGSQVFANPNKPLWASSSGGGGGGSYPRDASFNSITIDPSGIASPLTIGPGTGGTVLGIRRTEVGVPTDYILFDPNDTGMALSNVTTINGAPYAPTLTDYNYRFQGGAPLAEDPDWSVVNTMSFTAPTDGNVYLEGVGTYVSTSFPAAVSQTFAVDGSNIPEAIVTAGFYDSNVNAFTTTMTQFAVLGGTTYDISGIARCSAFPSVGADVVINSSRMFLMFTPN